MSWEDAKPETGWTKDRSLLALERPAWVAGAFRRSDLWPGCGCNPSDGCGGRGLSNVSTS